MYNYLGLALFGLFAFMVIPYQTQADSNGGIMYGTADIIVYDKSGNEILTQTVHNRLVDQGEDYLISSTFRDGDVNGGQADSYRVDAICLTSFDVSGVSETYTAVNFDTNNNLDNTASPCVVDVQVDTTTQGKAVIGPLIFQIPQNAPLTGDIKGIGICRSGSGQSTGFSFIGCDDFNLGTPTGQVLFAVVDTTDILNVQQDQTISVRYTFDITSPSS